MTIVRRAIWNELFQAFPATFSISKLNLASASCRQALSAFGEHFLGGHVNLKLLISISSAFVLSLGCSAGGGSGSNQAGKVGVKNSKPDAGNVVLVGDSLANSRGAQNGNLLKDCLAEKLNRNVEKVAQDGTTTADFVDQMEQIFRSNQPAIIVLSLGGNDAIQSAAGVDFPPEKTYENLRKMYRELTNSKVMVVHMGLNPKIAGAERLPGIQAVAESEGALFVPDVLEGMWGNSQYMSDSYHPNAVGYLKVCDRIAAAMEPYL